MSSQSDFLIPDSHSVYVGDIARVGGASVFLICILSLSFWLLSGFVIINPFISLFVGCASIVFVAMGTTMNYRRFDDRRVGG
jgi:hypothetical protein